MKGEVRHPERETVMLICAGLGVWGVKGEKLFRSAGYDMDSEEMLPYRIVLNYYKNHTIYECDEVLVHLRCKSIIK